MKNKKNGTLRIGLLGISKYGMRSKMITILLAVKVIPIIIITVIAFQQINLLGKHLRDIAVSDSTAALNQRAVENIERITTDTASAVADFLYQRDDDILVISKLVQKYAKDGNYLAMQEVFDAFAESKTGEIIKPVQEGEWELQLVEETKLLNGVEITENIQQWVRVAAPVLSEEDNVSSSNEENNLNNGFNYRRPNQFEYIEIPLYDEITYINKSGKELAKVVSGDIIARDTSIPENEKYYPKSNYSLSKQLKDISIKANTYVKAETYFDKLKELNPTDKNNRIYVSDVIGAYVGTNYIGMYTPKIVEKARGEDAYDNLSQAYAGEENPYGQRFEGIIRFATPVTDGETVLGYVTFALNHDHIMEFVDRQTPMDERYTELPSAYKGNYAFIWDYKCRSICHPRHHSIVGYNPETGDAEIPWLEETIFWDWLYNCYNTDIATFTETMETLITATNDSGARVYKGTSVPMVKNGEPYTLIKTDFSWASGINVNLSKTWIEFINERVNSGELVEYNGYNGKQQSRNNSPSADLTRMGFVGLDGRYLNNAPQCTGWMDLTEKGGSGSLYIKWSGLDKLTTAAAIPYYSGQYAPSEENGNSLRGFGIVTIGAGLDDFTRPANETEIKLTDEINKNLGESMLLLVFISIIIILLVILIAIFLASSLTGSIKDLIFGIARFRSGERQFRFKTTRKDEFGTLAHSFDDMADGIVDSVKHPLAITDMDHKVKYMNQYGLDFCDITLDEIVGTYYGDISVYPSKSKFCPIQALEEKREADIFYFSERGIYLKGKAGYLLDKNGEKTGYIIETADMTDVVKKQLKIAEQNILLDRIFAASPDLIWYKNTEDEYLAVNPRFASIAGMSTEEFIGKKGEYILPESAKLMLEHDREALKSVVPIYNEEVIRFADGHEETLESVRTPILNQLGITIGMLGFARNVTERVRIEHALRKTQLDLETAVSDANRANQHKGEFLARMSHEIRTPMNAIIGITNIVSKKLDCLEGEKSKVDDIKLNVAQIESSSKHLLGLLNDILDISKIEAGKIELADETTDLAKLIKAVYNLIAPRCREKNINFILSSDDFNSCNYVCDSLRLRQVLINLLGNAVKFTHECGVVELAVKKMEYKAGKTLINFSVRDTGIGISEDAKKTIFQAFEQGDNKIPRQYGGTGLGLAISRRIVQLFGGDITVESEIGEGSTFSFAIWLKDTDTQIYDESETLDVDGKYLGKNILLVDDIELNRIIVKSILENTGAMIVEADDGNVAVEKFKESKEYFYDLVLMDIKMPNMGGHEASAIIRALSRPDAKTTPIIALTANAFKEDIDEAIKNGMNAHVSKPVEVNTLIRVCNRYLLDK